MYIAIIKLLFYISNHSFIITKDIKYAFIYKIDGYKFTIGD